MQSLSLF